MANDSTSGPELDSSAAAIDSPSSASSGSFCTELCAAVKSGLRANRLPGTISFVVGATILVSYYGGGETTRPAFDALATLRDEGGMLFAAIATSVAAGVLPSIIQLAMRQVPDPVVPTIVFNCVFWFVMGPVVSGLYELQVVLFGDGTDVATVVKKVLFDQFVWNPCFWPLMSLISDGATISFLLSSGGRLSISEVGFWGIAAFWLRSGARGSQVLASFTPFLRCCNCQHSTLSCLCFPSCSWWSPSKRRRQSRSTMVVPMTSEVLLRHFLRTLKVLLRQLLLPTRRIP